MKMKRFPLGHLALALAALTTVLTAGCAVALLGAGAGAAATAYVMGEQTRTYEGDYAEAVRASTEALGALKIPVAGKAADELKTVISARRPDGTPVEVEVVRIAEKQTEVGVRTGYVGVWDQRTSRQIHDLIGERLARSAARPGASVKNEPPPPPPHVEAAAPGGEQEPAKKKTVSKTALPAPPADAPSDVYPAAFDPDLTIFFASGADEMAPAEIEKLDRIAAVLRDNPATVASLHGYSDAHGKASQNLVLSVGRAEAVKRHLAAKGCTADQLLVIGHGAAKFLGSNESDAGRRLNRRVEIEIHNTP